MAPGKRRKLTATATVPSQLPQIRRGIEAFGKISKGHNAVTDGSKKSIVTDATACPSCPTDALPTYSPSKKRKLDRTVPSPGAAVIDESVEPVLLLHEKSQRPTPSTSPQKFYAKRLPRQNEDPTTIFQTPTKSARGRLARFKFEASSSPITPTRLSSPSLGSNDTPPTSPCSPHSPHRDANPQASDLPPELEEFIALHASFLTALSIHYAHHGMSSPADLKLLTKSTERKWGKRKVVVKDIQTLIGVMDMVEKEGDVPRCSFKLKNIGLGRIVLENSISSSGERFTPRMLDEVALRDAFETLICRLWTARCGNNGNVCNHLEFLKTLPTATITTCPFVIASASKTQRKLEDLKAGAIKVVEKKSSELPPATEKDADEVIIRGNSLLERLKAKELYQAKLPPPLSKEKMLRRSALQRVPDVVGVLSMLKTSAGTKRLFERSSTDVRLNEKSSFSFPTLVQKVKDSAQCPISREEVEMCLHLLNTELAVEWVKSHSIGKLKCIVVYHQKQPGLDILKQRIAEALKI
jgi:hypothetical protein